jgi:hypothetical protein
MDSKELEMLKELDGPSPLTQTRAKRYVTDSIYRGRVDAEDKLRGTKAGPELRATYFGEKPAAAAPATIAPLSAVEMAAVCKQFPKARCLELFKRDANTPGEIAANLSKSDYQTAKLAAQFFGVLDQNNTSSVKFVYPTSRDRAAKREVSESAARNAERKQAETLPPGVQRDAQGNLILADEQAFTNWKASKSEHAEAIAFLEDAAK